MKMDRARQAELMGSRSREELQEVTTTAQHITYTLTTVQPIHNDRQGICQSSLSMRRGTQQASFTATD